MTDQMPPMPSKAYSDAEPNSFRCARHGVYGTEWPWPTSCGYCTLESHARDLAARLAASQALVGDLAEKLGNLTSWVENMGEFDLEDPVWFATVKEAHAALTRFQEATR